MPREPFVDERVVGADQIQHAAILAQRARQKQPRLLFEGLQQAVVEVRIRIGIDDDLADAAEVQPLGGEVVDERARGARVGQHAPHLLLERRRLRQLAALRGVEQRIVGDAVPEEERQARRELEIRQAIRSAFRAITIDAQQEVGIDQHALERELNPGVKAAAFTSSLRKELQQRLYV